MHSDLGPSFSDPPSASIQPELCKRKQRREITGVPMRQVLRMSSQACPAHVSGVSEPGNRPGVWQDVLLTCKRSWGLALGASRDAMQGRLSPKCRGLQQYTILGSTAHGLALGHPCKGFE